jgi:hypothetical protein
VKSEEATFHLKCPCWACLRWEDESKLNYVCPQYNLKSFWRVWNRLLKYCLLHFLSCVTTLSLTGTSPGKSHVCFYLVINVEKWEIPLSCIRTYTRILLISFIWIHVVHMELFASNLVSFWSGLYGTISDIYSEEVFICFWYMTAAQPSNRKHTDFRINCRFISRNSGREGAFHWLSGNMNLSR